MDIKKTILFGLLLVFYSHLAFSQILKDTVGIASYYADKFNGRKTSNGEKFDNKKLTAAHRTLPFGTNVLVTNPKNSKQVVVKINDRGPYAKNRLIDLSKAAAKELDLITDGLGKVHIRVIDSLPIMNALPEITNDTLFAETKVIDTILLTEKVAEIKQDIEKKWFYGVQVGSFKEPENIEKIKNSISEITDATIFVFEYPKNNEILYQVVVGNFENQKKAIALRKKLQTHIKDAFVTHYKN